MIVTAAIVDKLLLLLQQTITSINTTAITPCKIKDNYHIDDDLKMIMIMRIQIPLIIMIPITTTDKTTSSESRNTPLDTKEKIKNSNKTVTRYF